jgi:hypothetical protein
VEPDILNKGGRAVGDGVGGLAGIDIDKESGKPFGDEGFRIAVEKEFPVLEGRFEVHEALAAGNEVGGEAGGWIERGELPAQFNNFLITGFGGWAGCKNYFEGFLFLEARFERHSEIIQK